MEHRHSIPPNRSEANVAIYMCISVYVYDVRLHVRIDHKFRAGFFPQKHFNESFVALAIQITPSLYC